MHSFGSFGMGGGFGPGGVIGLFGAMTFIFIIWSLFWKAWALWLAARRGEKIWFGLLLIINTLGLLEIIYIFAVAKQSDKPVEKKATEAPKETPKEHHHE